MYNTFCFGTHDFLRIQKKLMKRDMAGTMKRRYGKRLLSLLLPMLLGLALIGCGKEEEVTSEVIVEQDYIGPVATNTIRVDRNGKITEIAVEDYSEIQYNLKELERFIREEIRAYNRKKGVDKVAFLQIREEGTVIKTAISYTDLEAFNDFNRMNVKLSVYSAETADRVAEEEAKQHAVEDEEKKELSETELAEAGYDPSTLDEDAQTVIEEKAVEATFTDANGNTVSSDAISANENMMIVTDEKLAVEAADGKLLYTNNHAAISDGVARTDGEGTAIVVLFLGI